MRVCVHKGTAGQTVGYAIGHSIRRGQICLFGGTIELFLSEKRKAAKNTGALTQRIEEIGESYGDEHSS